MKWFTLLCVLSFAGCGVQKQQTAKSEPENEITGKRSFFSPDVFPRILQFRLEVDDQDGDNNEVVRLILPSVEKCITTVRLYGVFYDYPAYLKVLSLGVNKYSGNTSVHIVPIYEKNRAVVISSPVHLEVQEWANEEKVCFRNYYGERWQLISVASPTHSERMKRIGLMGPGQYRVFYDEKGCFHAQFVLDSGMIWEYQLKSD